MESAELTILNSQSTEGILLETETGQTNNLILNASRLGSEATQIDAGGQKYYKRLLLLVRFTMGEIIKGSNFKSRLQLYLAEDNNNNGKFIITTYKINLLKVKLL